MFSHWALSATCWTTLHITQWTWSMSSKSKFACCQCHLCSTCCIRSKLHHILTLIWNLLLSGFALIIFLILYTLLCCRFLWRKNVSFAISRHYRRFDVFEEAEANKAGGKYDNASIDNQIEFYKREGLTHYSSAKLPITSGNLVLLIGFL